VLKSMTNTNLPSSWTKGKMTKLLLLSGFSNLVNAGQAFENCLIIHDCDYYSALLDYDLYNNERINNSLLFLCCYCIYSSSQCQCTNYNSSCGSIGVYCTRVGQTIVCTDGPVFCGGVVGNTTITTNTTLNPSACPNDLTIITGYINSLPNNSIIGLDQGYAYYYCSSTPCDGFICSWDNDGWTCFNQYALDCILQWTAPWPGPNNTNPLLSTVLTLATVGGSMNFFFVLGVSVGSVVGVALLGYLLLLLYCSGCCSCEERTRRRRERQQEIERAGAERERRRQEDIGLQNISLRGEVQNLKTQKARQDAELNRLGQRIQELTSENTRLNVGENVHLEALSISEEWHKEQIRKKDQEIQAHLEALDKSKEWNERQKEELQKEIQRLKAEKTELQFNLQDQISRNTNNQQLAQQQVSSSSSYY